ncbi:hypothetical protein NDU88_005016 [Pleurodeles waltl]|uniref:Uncharacterized protein n=1 Tax=Pleurodeles waltl TaxID=8319 RepID=A0AAV7QJZ4_PLEWA|nr:hypothetical protein NDU88_005016 [Pleurodeles waltl]
MLRHESAKKAPTKTPERSRAAQGKKKKKKRKTCRLDLRFPLSGLQAIYASKIHRRREEAAKKRRETAKRLSKRRYRRSRLGSSNAPGTTRRYALTPSRLTGSPRSSPLTGRHVPFTPGIAIVV